VAQKVPPTKGFPPKKEKLCLQVDFDKVNAEKVFVITLKGQGARAENRRKVLVEATEGCNINRGKFARKIKSTKFENKFC
jgi:hypothetical protein